VNDLVKIKNVRGYLGKDGMAYLNLEDVSRGLGFTTVATSGNEVVRWARVTEYLKDLGFAAEVSKDTFIPENIFYRLAMKAKNEVAEKFQTLIADEILPQIRKTGTYVANKPLTALEALRQTVDALTEQAQRIDKVEATQQAIKAAVIAEPDNWREDTNHKINKIAKAIGMGKFQEVRTESYKLLEARAHVDLKRRLVNHRGRLLEHGFPRSAIDRANYMDVIDQDPKLREIYGKIVSEYLIKYVA
jgi:prophage antirepressor-like protein